MSRRPVIGLGAGGHARVVIDLLRTLDMYDIVGLVDADGAASGRHVADVPVVGTDVDLERLRRDGIDAAFVAIGSTGDPRPRHRAYANAVRVGFEMITAVHPSAVVSRRARLGPGVVVMALAAINADADVRENAIVNTGAVIEHECVVGAHAHVATGARLAGDVRIGDGAHIGIGAVVLQGVRIGRNVIVGAGAVVLEDVADDVVVAGVPARQLRRKEYAWPI